MFHSNQEGTTLLHSCQNTHTHPHMVLQSVSTSYITHSDSC